MCYSTAIKTTWHTMSGPLREILQRRYVQRHPVLPYVFWHKFYDRKKKEHWEDRYQSLNRFTERLCKKAAVPRFGLHQLRHLASSILKEHGNMGIAKLQRFLRHDDQKTTEIYSGHLETDTKEQNDFLGKFWNGEISWNSVRKSYRVFTGIYRGQGVEFTEWGNELIFLSKNGRGERIWTSGLLLPRQAR